MCELPWQQKEVTAGVCLCSAMNLVEEERKLLRLSSFNMVRVSVWVTVHCVVLTCILPRVRQ